jgi:hypothetical protein
MIEIIKEKPIKSSTSVEGIIVQVTGGQWYGITLFQAARNPWMGRCGKSTTTGRMDFSRGTEIFQTRFATKPENFEELKAMLISVLNGAEPIKHTINYN